jgi:hypothetical protein
MHILFYPKQFLTIFGYFLVFLGNYIVQNCWLFYVISLEAIVDYFMLYYHRLLVVILL